MATKSGARIDDTGGRVADGGEQFEIIDPASLGSGGDSGNGGGGNGGGNPGPGTGDDPGTDSSGERWDPDKHSTPARKRADGTWRARRGSGGDGTAGSGGSRRSTKKEAHYSVSGVEQMLFSIHMGVAAMTRAPELALTQAEAKNLATAAVEVAKLYPQLNVAPEVVAWMNFTMAAGAVYLPRIIAIRNRMKSESMTNVTPKTPAPTFHAPPQTTPEAPSTQAGPVPPTNPAGPELGPGTRIGPDFFQ